MPERKKPASKQKRKRGSLSRKRAWTELTILPKAAATYGIHANVSKQKNAYTSAEAAKIIGVDPDYVRQWIHDRRLPAIKIPHGHWHIPKDGFEKSIRHRLQRAKRKILIAGANRTVLEGRSADLESAGYETLITQSLMDGLLKATDHFPALFIIDVTRWPEGWDLGERLRKTRSARHSVILLMCQKTLKSAERSRAKKLRAQACLSSDLDATALLQEVEKLLPKPNCDDTDQQTQTKGLRQGGRPMEAQAQ